MRLQGDRQPAALRRYPQIPVTLIPRNALFCGRGTRRTMAILAAAVLLSACSLFGDDEEKASATGAKAAPKTVARVQPNRRVCPGLAVLRDAATITKFRPGGGRGEADIVYQGEITDARISCLHDLRKPKSSGNFMTDLLARAAPPPPVGTMKMEITVIMRATNGPAAPPGPITMPYFVSVTDAQKNVLNKGAFEVAVDFPKARSRRLVTDAPIKLEIPIAKGQTGAEYGVFIGYQLTREELQYNRSGRTILLR